MVGRKQKERHAVIRQKNRRMLDITLFVSLIGVPPVSLFDLLAQSRGSYARLLAVVAIAQMIIFVAVALLRLLKPRRYRQYAT